jgi:hypothetical protein
MKNIKNFLIVLLFTQMSLVFAEDSFYPSIGRHRTIDEVDRSKYYEYKERLKERRVYALETRRQLNAGKVHRYWTAIRVYPNYYYGRNYYPSYNYSTVERYRLEEVYRNSYYGY